MTDDDQRAAVRIMGDAMNDALQPGEHTMGEFAAVALRALRAAGWSVSRWQPIETWDGEDGVEVDLWAKGRRYADCHYHLGQWLYWCYAGVDQEPYWATVESPTHWMPLPEPPK